MSLILPFLVSLIITILSIPITLKFAFKFGLVDNPKTRPHPAHLHTRIIARAGGLPIYLGIIFSILIFLPLERSFLGIIFGSTILLLVGLIDDKVKKFNPYVRLLLLFLAALVVVSFGVGINFISNPLSGFNFLPFGLNQPYIRFDQIIIPFVFLGNHYLVLVADIFAFFYITTLTQVINWSKGVDGQMPGITCITALTLGFLSLKLLQGGDPNQFFLAQLSFIVAGASLGFLIFNWFPAKIFPGFSGSTILALVLATISILSGAKVATALLVLAIPTIDFIYTFFRRILSGKSPVWGDRGHLHHRLLDLGLSHPQIALFYIVVSAILGSIALIVDTESKFFGVLVVAVIFIGFILALNSFYDRRSKINE
ncbi:undecaprenyl/decaprenyl-phosphate alpha-N-acetylglucosaminyl 1-phosphate transferase [Candidatus Daviesbacteria bacterium]|nr:undecaprenyl/decaprenyl-phosphate alpha-N-acetylglucosaminyl 1-phosphate transferase [Candidatus Daviesbacteria bacterium]